MKKNYLYIVSFAAFAFLMMSCADDEIIESPTILSPSKTIAFDADIEWTEPDQTRSASPNRVSNFSLLTDTGEEVLPCGVYVQDGIQYNGEEKPLTRGAVINRIGDSFNVWATYTKDNVSSEFFSNLEFSKGSGDVFNSLNTYYWPGSGTLDFVAVSNTPASNFAHQMSSDGSKLESFIYTVPADATQQNDIIVAIAKGIAGDNNTSVPLSFKHIMSAVNVKIGSVVKGEIQSITFKNVYNKGKYLVEQDVWVVDKTSVGDFTVTMQDGKFVSSGTDAEGTPVNTKEGTFMFIPQNPGDNAEMVIEFLDSNTGHLYSDDATKNPYKPALRGSIAGDNWDKSKTVNYMLSIDESFTLTIEPVGKKLDAHYVIGYANVTVDGIDNWTIEVSSDISSDEQITIQPEEEVNPLAKQGFWTDKVVGANGNVTTESTRGSDSWSGTGNVTNKLFYIFIPENVSDKDRQISLTLRGTGDASTVSTTKVLLQKYPNWTDGGFGWEVVDDDESGKYGFKWTRKVAYIYPYGQAKIFDSKVEDYCKNWVSTYGADANGFASVVVYSHDWKSDRAYILLDYSKLNNITGADSGTDGFSNTLALYRQAGTTATSQFETILKTTLKTESGKETENMFRLPNDDEVSSGKVPAESGTANDLSAVMEIIQKKNRYYVQKKSQTDSNGNPIVTYVPYFFENDLKWYLPAYGQFQYFVPNPNIAGDAAANYWSSTTAGTTTAWTGGGEEKDRDLEYRVIAVRKNDN